MLNLMAVTDRQVHKLNGIGCKLLAYLKCGAGIVATAIDVVFAMNLYRILRKGELGYAVVGAFALGFAWDRLLSIIILWRNGATVSSGEKQVGINKFKATLRRKVVFAKVVLMVFKGFVSAEAMVTNMRPNSTKGQQLVDKFAFNCFALFRGFMFVALAVGGRDSLRVVATIARK
ncbi:hypothetical protein BDR26DRAFT_1011551 [Obelidium mucronatum]|nr:hypothetical protein BDR26DRAFT_1011551 [Obelidium mucronatum]